jgi:hypothetical protein
MFGNGNALVGVPEECFNALTGPGLATMRYQVILKNRMTVML